MTGLWEQLSAFTVTLCLGMVVGLFYDLYFVFKAKLRLKRWGTVVGDSVFWLVVTAVVFFVLLITICAELRFFIFLGILIGFVGQQKTVSKSIRRICSGIWSKCSCFVMKFLAVPQKIFARVAGKMRKT